MAGQALRAGHWPPTEDAGIDGLPVVGQLPEQRQHIVQDVVDGLGGLACRAALLLIALQIGQAHLPGLTNRALAQQPVPEAAQLSQHMQRLQAAPRRFVAGQVTLHKIQTRLAQPWG